MSSCLKIIHPHYFLKSEVDRILLAVKNDPKLYIFCKFLWRTGVRVSEALDVTPKDIDYMKGVVVVKTCKRRKDRNHNREIPLQQDLIDDLKKFIKSRAISINQPIFPFTGRTAFNYVKKACSQADYTDDRSHPSSFRHSYALHCLMNGLAINDVNELLGNRDIKKTMIYLKIIQEKKSFNNIVW
ncbi:tyrosine-type recombinase/integrase [Desulfotomaculum sp. 1211_IL3151]|uniref:tyrosine-type recombinase/integrase n=1 Tax=Desulfotomaculum sp. 1211_IL3151 TaxID=3084055 RepID=UPI002FD96B43